MLFLCIIRVQWAQSMRFLETNVIIISLEEDMLNLLVFHCVKLENACETFSYSIIHCNLFNTSEKFMYLEQLLCPKACWYATHVYISFTMGDLKWVPNRNPQKMFSKFSSWKHWRLLFFVCSFNSLFFRFSLSYVFIYVPAFVPRFI